MPEALSHTALVLQIVYINVIYGEHNFVIRESGALVTEVNHKGGEGLYN